MEVGAVKQAFNNEVIQLKKNLNQAKLQVIHKLTRKAKTLTEKKSPEHLIEKNKKKAESAIKEVLLMKKLKPRDIARFIITNKGELNTYLNKPTVDNDKACARLLLHKSLQQKYKIIKTKFGDIPIKDLLMSRQERIKLKKEAKDAQKNKKKVKKEIVVNSEGDWNVEDVGMGDSSKKTRLTDDDESDNDNSHDENKNNNDSNPVKEKHDVSNDRSLDISDDDSDILVTRQVVNGSDESSEGEGAENDDQDSFGATNDENMEKDNSDDDGQNSDNDKEVNETINFVKLKPYKQTTPKFLIPKPVTATTDIENVLSKVKTEKKRDKKVKDKNKNLNEKMLNRKFKKDTSCNQIEQKVVDPFFKTATGESYMSVAEPRQPDEFKEVHRQGNRQERRAAMFGRAAIKPRNNRQNYGSSNFDSRNGKESNEKFNGNDRRGSFNNRNTYNDRNSTFNDRNSRLNDRSSKFSDRNTNFNDRNSKYNDRNSNFNDRNSKFNDRSSNFNDRNAKFNDRKFNNDKVTEPKEEKLHPSWEAKKKQSGILPFKGKKIVFDES